MLYDVYVRMYVFVVYFFVIDRYKGINVLVRL